MTELSEEQKRDFEAAAFRTLVEHLRERNDVQNIDLMNLAGFCRNCLSNWYRDAAEAAGVAAHQGRVARDRLRHALCRMAGEAPDRGGRREEGRVRGCPSEGIRLPAARISRRTVLSLTPPTGSGIETAVFLSRRPLESRRNFPGEFHGRRNHRHQPDRGRRSARAFIERVERLEEEKQSLADDIKEVYAEMKGTGFDTKAVRTIIRLRKKDQAERQEEEAMLDLYKAALGMA